MMCPEKFDAIADIRHHLATVGSKHWRLVRARYPSVSSATFFRYVREAKNDEFVDQNVRALGRYPVTGQLEVDRELPGSELTVADAVSMPPRIDYLAEFRQLFADAKALEAYSLNADSTIRFPLIFDRALGTQLKLILRAVKLERQIYDVRNVQTFMDTLINEIALESPELQRRLMARLRALNSGDGKFRGQRGRGSATGR